jgi:hypothetical protein
VGPAAALLSSRTEPVLTPAVAFWDVARAFGVGRSTLYRAIGARAGDGAKAAVE